MKFPQIVFLINTSKCLQDMQHLVGPSNSSQIHSPFLCFLGSPDGYQVGCMDRGFRGSRFLCRWGLSIGDRAFECWRRGRLCHWRWRGLLVDRGRRSPYWWRRARNHFWQIRGRVHLRHCRLGRYRTRRRHRTHGSCRGDTRRRSRGCPDRRRR